MLERINERISVLTSYNKGQGITVFHKLRWNGRIYPISQMGYHHMTREGRNIQHVFHVVGLSLSFKLKLDTETLAWWLLEVSDGN